MEHHPVLLLYSYQLHMITYRQPCRHVQHDYMFLSSTFDFSIFTSTHSGCGDCYCYLILLFTQLFLHSNIIVHNVNYIIALSYYGITHRTYTYILLKCQFFWQQFRENFDLQWQIHWQPKISKRHFIQSHTVQMGSTKNGRRLVKGLLQIE